MADNVTQQLEKLAARRFLYAVGQALFGGEPTEETLRTADPGLVAEALGIVGLGDEFGVVDALAHAAGHADELKPEYTRLLVGPEKLAAPPWESVYRTKSRSLFQRETLDVRNAYRSQGFLPESYPRVADDHVALELGFLAALAERAAQAAEQGLDEEVREWLAISARFLDDHLCIWIGHYASDLAAEAPDSLYASLAQTLASFVPLDLSFAREASASEKSADISYGRDAASTRKEETR